MPTYSVSKQHVASLPHSSTMTDEFEAIDVQDRPETLEQKALCQWITGSKTDVDQRIPQVRTPITEPLKGRYVGFRNSSERAAERHQQRCRKEGKPFVKEDIRLLEVHLEKEAFARMDIRKLNEPEQGWATRLPFETYSNSSEDWGVWYDFGESFDLLESGVRRAREGWRRRRVVGGGREGKEVREGRV